MSKVGRKAAANWGELKTEYISDNTVTYEGLAKKYGVSSRSVKRHAVEDNWKTARKDIVQQVTNNVTKRAIDNMEEVNERHTKAYRNMQAFALTNLNLLYDAVRDEIAKAKKENRKVNTRDVYSSQMAKFLAETLRIAMDGERITLGLPTVVTKGEHDVNLKNEFADKPLDELEKLFKAVDEPNENNTAASRKS
jgi:hypothetical protein